MKFKLRHIILLFSILLGMKAGAQNFPVQAFVTVSPPYSSYLPDYSDPFDTRMKIILTLTDFAVPSYQVKLRFKIQGQGYSMQSADLINFQPITLSPGVPVEVTGADLAPYLATQNLVIAGMNVAQYEQSKVLPEGPATICVEVVDYNSGSQSIIGNPACASTWFAKYEPPMLNTPFCGSEITVSNPQQIMFSWTPLHMASPNNGGTQYTFELFEVWNQGDDPNFIVNSTLPSYMEVTNNTFVNYGITQTPLVVGNTYVWRVRAQEMNGRDLFTNQGYSQVCTFVYGNAAENAIAGATLTLQSNGTGTRQGLAWWNNSGPFSSYILEVRKTGNPNYEWFPYTTGDANIKVNSLEPETEYECRVKGKLGTAESDWSNTSTFTTYPKETYQCGSNNMPGRNPNIIPLEFLLPGHIVSVGQFEMRVTSAEPTGTPGYFNGYGKIEIPFMFMNVNVSYENLLIDEDMNVRGGQVNAITQGVDAWMADQFTEYVDGTISEIQFNEQDSLVTIYLEDGSSVDFPWPTDAPLIVEDESGLIYTINPDGTFTISGQIQWDNDQLAATADSKVTFHASPNQLYGFDEKKHLQWQKQYPCIKLMDSTLYFVPWKSVGSNQTDKVYAVVHGSEIGTPSFKDKNGVSQAATQVNDSTWEVTVGNLINAGIQVYAHDADGAKVGKLNVLNYATKTIDVVVIPVNGATPPNSLVLQDSLNKVFNQAYVFMNVTVAPAHSFAFDLNNNGLDAPNATLMSKYSAEMKALRDDYFATNNQENKLYLFVVDDIEGDLKGYMVRGKSVGFIDASNSSSPNYLRTYAHEIGHGGFGLEHTFPTIGQGQTENLMDYSDGSHLSAVQWKAIHDWQITWSIFDDEEDGALSIAGLDDLTQLQNADSSTYTFFNPNGYFVTIPETCTKVYLSTLEKFTSQNPLPIGTLVGFKNENGDLYEVKRHSQGYIFYECDQTQDIYIDSLTAQVAPTEGIFGVTYVDNTSSHQGLGNILAKITSSYFKAPSPIGQTTYTAQNETPFYKFFLYGEQYISASEYNVLTPQSFINKLKTGNEVKIVEQFNILHNDQINLNAFDYFGGSRNPIDFLRQEFDENTTIKEYVVFYDFINTPLIELASQISCLDQIISEENGAYKTLIMEQVGSSDFTDPINNIQTIHESIEEAILRYDDVNTIAAEVPTNGLQPLLDHAENLDYHCFFDALSYDNRVIVLDAVIKDDDYWWYDDINLLNELFVNASSDDQIKLIKKLKTDNWLQELNDQVFEWDDLRDDLDFEALQEFFASITPVFIQNYDQFTVTHQTKTITAQGQTQSIVLNNIPGSALHSSATFTLDMPATYTYESNYNEYPIFIGEHEGLYNIYDALNTMPDAFKESIFAKLDPSNDEVPFTFENGKYTVNCKYQLSSYDENVMPLDHQQKSSDPDNIFLYMQDEYTLDPFEFVELHFTSTYGSQSIEVGTSVVVPAFEMFMYDRAVGLHKTQWISRLVLDAVEITVGALAYLSAPATFGGSVAAFTAIVAAIDAAVTYDRNNPNYTLDQYNDPFYNNWDAFKTATDLTALGVGSIQAFKAVGGIIKNRKAIAVACMLNYNIRRTKSIVNGVSGLDNSRHFLYLESLRLGRSLDDVEDAFVFPNGFVGNGFNELLDGARYFDDNIMDIADVGFENWKIFQTRVSSQLRALYPNNLIGSQITLDVTYIENGVTKVKTIIPDDLIQIDVNGVMKYKIIDAKTSMQNLVTKTDLTSTCTSNQKVVYPMVDGGGADNGITITKVEMRGQNAIDAFPNEIFDAGKAQVQIETGVEFWVNSSTTDFTQYLIRSRIQ